MAVEDDDGPGDDDDMPPLLDVDEEDDEEDALDGDTSEDDDDDDDIDELDDMPEEERQEILENTAVVRGTVSKVCSLFLTYCAAHIFVLRYGNSLLQSSTPQQLRSLPGDAPAMTLDSSRRSYHAMSPHDGIPRTI